jgi:Domain of unknown function (DUF4383)
VSIATGSAAEWNSQLWSPARAFMLVAAVVHIPLGIIGLLYDQTFPIGQGAAAAAGSDHILGVLETNGWHSLAALGLGIVTAYFTFYPRRAREAAFFIGVFHVGLVVSLLLWDPSTFWLASNGADQIVHISTAVGGIGSALLTRPLPSRDGISTT